MVICDAAQKTIDNNLPNLRRLVEETDNLVWIKNFNDKNLAIYSIHEKIELTLKLKPKIYTYTRSKDYPRIIINLPDPPKGFDHWKLVPLSDIHYGASTCDLVKFREDIEYVERTPNVITCLPGDIIENSVRDSPGAGIYKQFIPPQEQKERVINDLAKIAHKILWVNEGNHGYRSVKGVFLNPEKDIANTLGAEYFYGQAFIDLVCGDQKWDIYSYHGKGSATTPMGRVNMLQKKSNFHDADIYMMGHVHDRQVAEDWKIVKEQNGIGLITKKRLFVICGTYQKYFGDYAEEWALPPNTTGPATIILHCDNSKTPGAYEAHV